jgi:hypothetical protein
MSISIGEDGIRHRTNSNGVVIKLCNAKVSHGECNQPAVSGRNFCINHGGRASLVHEHGNFVHGLNSANKKRFSNIGQQLLTRINELRDDPELFSLKDDAAYITAIIDQRAEAATEGISGTLLRELSEAYLSAARAYKSGDIPAFQESFKALGTMLTEGANSVKATDEVLELIARRVDIVESEQRMTHAKAYTLEVDQAYSLINQFLAIIKGAVRDADELTAIKSGVIKLLKTYKSESEQDIIDVEVVDEEA